HRGANLRSERAMPDPNPLAGKALSYLIGGDGPQTGQEGRITETGYGVGPARFGLSVGYCNLRREDGEPPEYAPYLPHDDIYRKFGEGRPGPDHPGYDRNIVEQVDLCRQLGHKVVEHDNPDSYSISSVMHAVGLSQQRGRGTTGAGATPTAQVLTTLISAFGGLELTAKIDRAVRAMDAISAATQEAASSPLAR